MKQPRAPNVSTDMRPPPPTNQEIEGAPIDQPDGDAGRAVALVVSAYEAHHAEIFAVLAGATRDRSVAEDLLQRTYRRYATEAASGRPPLDVRGWLHHVAAGLAVEHANRRSTALGWLRRDHSGERGRTVAPSPEQGVSGGERTAGMERVLEGLSTEARLAILLSGAGLSGDEIAAAIGRSGAATRTLLSTARARIRIRRELFGGGR